MLKIRKGTTIIRYIICILTLSFSQVVCAKDLQKFFVRNNDTVLAIISERELSRFVFKGDKVKQIFSIGGELHYEILDENLYIKPSVQKPVNFFVNTESGNTYKIIATPKDIPATQVFISGIACNKYARVKQPLTGESVYSEKIAKIIKVVNSEDETVGYKVKSIGTSYKQPNGLSRYFDSEWWGDGLIAEKHFLFNDSDNPITIDRHSYLREAEAVYVDREVIKPGSGAILIKVRTL